MLDTSRAATSFGFVAKTPFEDGLRRTIESYRAERDWSSSAAAARSNARQQLRKFD
jgi:dTDP-D-glucose 4,6-dehydratase